MQLKKQGSKFVKALIAATAITLLAAPVMAGNGPGKGGSTGKGGKGTGTGICTSSALANPDSSFLLVRGGNDNGGNGPGDGTGSGDGPADGTGNGAGTGDCSAA